MCVCVVFATCLVVDESTATKHAVFTRCGLSAANVGSATLRCMLLILYVASCAHIHTHNIFHVGSIDVRMAKWINGMDGMDTRVYTQIGVQIFTLWWMNI